MTKLRSIARLAAAPLLAFATLAAANSPAFADARVEAGVLTCEVAGGAGFIVGSKKDMSCEFESANGYTETYTGSVAKFGIDIGETDRSYVKWVVLAPTVDVDRGALEGRYVGVSGEVTAGVGVGANALIGGFDQSLILQPFSGQVQSGLNIAVGIGAMKLISQ